MADAGDLKSPVLNGTCEFDPRPGHQSHVSQQTGSSYDVKVAVIGANGQLGSDLCRVLATRNTDVIPLLHRDVDVSDGAQVDRVLDSVLPDVVVSTAAYHKVDECEVQAQRA